MTPSLPSRSPSLRVRAASAKDRAFVAALAADALREYDSGAGERVRAMSVAPGTLTLIAFIAARPIGLAVLATEAGAAELLAIAVQADVRGQGVGRLLLGQVEAKARSRGARVMRLCTAEANVAATELFLKAGFVRERRFARYYKNGQNAVSMIKVLG
jgi:[ribosomal protein S18]-alanine N-acetyltransferase